MLVNVEAHNMLTRLSAARAVLRFNLPNKGKTVVAGRDASTTASGYAPHGLLQPPCRVDIHNLRPVWSSGYAPHGILYGHPDMWAPYYWRPYQSVIF